MLKISIKSVKYLKQLTIGNSQLAIDKIAIIRNTRFSAVLANCLLKSRTLLCPEHYKHAHHFLADG